MFVLKETITNIVLETAKEMLPKQRKQPKNKWMKPSILELMEERRKVKGKDTVKYNELNERIKEACNRAKEEWLDEQCKEIEQLAKRNDNTKYEKIRNLTGERRTTRSSTIKDKDGKILMETEEVLKRWSEYIDELFKDDTRRRPTIEKEMTGPPILREEIRAAMREMKTGKSPGNDNVLIEMLNAGGEIIVEEITELANKIYDTGIIPKWGNPYSLPSQKSQGQ